MDDLRDEFNQLIQEFNEDHNLETKDQFLMLVAEVGELADALLKDEGQDSLSEEIGDVEFVARSISLLEGINPDEAVSAVAQENAEKSPEKDGAKVTKS